MWEYDGIDASEGTDTNKTDVWWKFGDVKIGKNEVWLFWERNQWKQCRYQKNIDI